MTCAPWPFGTRTAAASSVKSSSCPGLSTSAPRLARHRARPLRRALRTEHAAWARGGVRTLAWRSAGRVPSVLDQLPPALAGALAVHVFSVLDFAGAA